MTPASTDMAEDADTRAMRYDDGDTVMAMQNSPFTVTTIRCIVTRRPGRITVTEQRVRSLVTIRMLEGLGLGTDPASTDESTYRGTDTSAGGILSSLIVGAPVGMIVVLALMGAIATIPVDAVRVLADRAADWR